MATDFRYTPTSGSLPGKSFEEQTQQAFNELGGQIDASDETAREALEVANSANNTANAALQEVQIAVDASNAAQEAAAGAVNVAGVAQTVALEARQVATEARTVANVAQDAVSSAFEAATNAENAVNAVQDQVAEANNRIDDAQSTAQSALDQAHLAMGVYMITSTAEEDQPDPEAPPVIIQFDADAHFDAPEKMFLVVDDSDPALNLPPLNFPAEVTLPFFFDIKVNESLTSVIQTVWDANGGHLFSRLGLVDRDDPDNPAATWTEWSSVGSDPIQGPPGPGVLLAPVDDFESDDLAGTPKGTGAQIAAMRAKYLRERLTKNTTFYIDAVNGNDFNDGLTPSTALKSVGGVQALLARYYWPAAAVTLSFAGGNYGSLFFNRATVSGALIVTAVDASAPVQFSAISVDGASVSFMDMTINLAPNKAWMALSARKQANVDFQRVKLNVSGSASIGISATQCSILDFGTCEIFFDGYEVNDNYYIVAAYDVGRVLFSGTTVSGAATGRRYHAQRLGVINTYGAGAGFIPGTIDGVAIAASGGYYI